MDTCYFLHILFMIISFSPHLSSSLSVLKQGLSLSVEDSEDVLVSPNGVFSAGFYPIGTNSYCFAVWFSVPSCTRRDCTTVWMANRDFPVNGRRSKISLQEDGNLILTDAGKSIAWSTDSMSLSSTELILSNLGNLVLQDAAENVVLWQSFDSPTDTLLPLQQFTKDMQLVSSRSRTNVSSGFYQLFFNSDNLLRLLYDDDLVSSIYWPDPWLVSWATTRFSYNSTRLAFLNPEGKFTSSDNLSFLAADYGSILQRRLTLDFDGNLRLYSRKENSLTWLVSWVALAKPCQIHGACGPNSQCIYDTVTNGRKCICLPGYKMKNTTDWSYGCYPEFNLACGNESNDSDQVHYIKLSNTEYYGYDYGVYAGYSVKQCEKLCSSLCNCKGFQYRYIDGRYWSLFTVMNNIRETLVTTVCYPKVSLLNGYRAPDYDGDFYVKVAETSPISDDSGFGLNCSAEVVFSPITRAYPKSHQNEKLNLIIWFGCMLGVIEITVILIVFSFLRSSRHGSNEHALGYHHVGITTLQRFTYSELKAATLNFSVEIGRGASGTVYKGTLLDNRIAAVKRLNTANQGEAEFLAEVSTIGKLHHMNLIEMWGYCVEKNHRLLVYQYMKHGSLAGKLSCQKLDWRRRFEIALGTARGLAYLHEECLEWVLHCDVKPENILLDSNYQPKVSDFGLSKLLNRGDDIGSVSTFSRMRGTRGYMAPEWVLNLPITSKVDVYSYGIVVLEMVTGKKCSSGSGNTGEEQEQQGMVEWIREKKNGGETWIEEIADPIFEGEYDKDEMEILVSLALQCVEEDKDSRPSMRKVTETLMHPQNYL